MCRFVVPIRTCSKCHQNEPLFDEKERRLSHVNEKIEVPQTSILRSHVTHCVPNSESQHTRHPPRIAIRGGVSSAANTLSLATPVGSLVNNRQWKDFLLYVESLMYFMFRRHGKTREIRGGSPSYVCHSCASCSQRHSPCKPPRGTRNGVLRRWEIGWFARLTKPSAK